MNKIRSIGFGVLLLAWLALTGLSWFGPDQEFSDAERRKLAQFPSLTADTVLSGRFMSDFETYSQDQFPMRDRFRQLKSMFLYYVLRQWDNNGIYLADGYAAALEYPLNRESAAYAGELFNRVYETYLADQDSKILFVMAPDKGYYLAAKHGFLSMDYEALTGQLKQAMPWAEFVDITDCLSGEDYYRTDTHWRQECLFPAARRICGALGVSEPAEENYTAEAVERPFYGVYYGQAALPMSPETIYVMKSPVIDGCTADNMETGKTAGVYDMEKLSGRDLYDVYLSGAAALLTVHNPAAASGRELIIFRDSFGSSLAPLLLEDYETVTLADLRYLPSSMLGDYLDFHGQDVLFLFSTLVLNNSYSMR